MLSWAMQPKGRRDVSPAPEKNDPKNWTELNAVDRLGDRAKENPNSAYQRHSENNQGDDSPEWRGAGLIPLGSNHEADCVPHVQFPSCRLGLMRRAPA